MKALVVEDDDRIAQAIAEALRDQRYVVEIAEDGVLGLNLAETEQFDIIILDVMLPRLDGISLCRRLRQQGITSPILMLTARDTSESKVLGLDVGADDYVIKPFDLPEFLARIRALLRRGSVAPSSTLEWEKLIFDPQLCQVTYDAIPLALTPTEYRLVELLLRNGSRVLSRGLILERVWEFEDMPAEETVKVHLRSLRQKLKQAGAPPNFIENVYGLGYRLNPNL
ncbi:MAG: response regulator transcription factor [Leptolyngbyaceae bacterium]|nr:response regulator transcription factor [Leptolyngbyaceae bacterium]